MLCNCINKAHFIVRMRMGHMVLDLWRVSQLWLVEDQVLLGDGILQSLSLSQVAWYNHLTSL